jgi:hypothetical protein
MSLNYTIQTIIFTLALKNIEKKVTLLGFCAYRG